MIDVALLITKRNNEDETIISKLTKEHYDLTV